MPISYTKHHNTPKRFKYIRTISIGAMIEPMFEYAISAVLVLYGLTFGVSIGVTK